MKEKTDIMVFKHEKLPTFICIDYKSHSLKPTNECRYFDVIIDRELTYQKQLDKVISKNGFRYQVNLFRTNSNTFKISNKSPDQLFCCI